MFVRWRLPMASRLGKTLGPPSVATAVGSCNDDPDSWSPTKTTAGWVCGIVAGWKYGGSMDIYLDNAATTRLDEVALKAMLPFLRDGFGNAAASCVRGRAAAVAVEQAREQLAGLLGVPPGGVVWTSGATEGLNAALKGLADVRDGRDVLVVAATEHKAVLDTAEWLASRRGVEVRVAPVGPDGIVDLDVLSGLVDDRTFAVAVMAANNETGVLAPLGQVGEVASRSGAAFVCDVTQAVGKVPVDLSGVDVAVGSAHKLYGPQGVGFVWVSRQLRPRPDALLHGGRHERGMRSGTLNLPGVVGAGAAAALAYERRDADAVECARLRDRLETELAGLAGGVRVHGAGVDRLPNITNLHIAGVDADALIVGTPKVAFSSGSACTSAVPTPSHVLMAMGVPTVTAEESIRLSVGRTTTGREVDDALGLLGSSIARIRDLVGAS